MARTVLHIPGTAIKTQVGIVPRLAIIVQPRGSVTFHYIIPLGMSSSSQLMRIVKIKSFVFGNGHSVLCIELAYDLHGGAQRSINAGVTGGGRVDVRHGW